MRRRGCLDKAFGDQGNSKYIDPETPPMKSNLPLLPLLPIAGLMWLLPLPSLQAQTLQQRCSTAMQRFAADPAMAHASVSLTVLDARNGKPVYSLHAETGLATASCLKTITAATAFYLLGPEYRYKTRLLYTGSLTGDVLRGDIVIRGSGDPTLGSWRYAGTRSDSILQAWVTLIRQKGIRRIEGRIIGDDRIFSTQTVPDGWIWQDMGNYYGAGASGLSWHENQYDLQLRPGHRVGAPVTILGTSPALQGLQFINELRTGPVGSGDHTYIYAAPYASVAYLRGTAPAGKNLFTVSGAVPDPALFCAQTLQKALTEAGITVSGAPTTGRLLDAAGKVQEEAGTLLGLHSSPPLDSIIYWFLQRSINLYGEHLLKTLALAPGSRPSADSGVVVEKKFWASRGLDPSAMHIIDGSGLSPGNRITTMAMAKVLYAVRQEPWFDRYEKALPLIHRIRMKSGHINDVRAYAGYLRSKENIPLVFAFFVNNYAGEDSAVPAKMFRVLDQLR